MPKELFKGSVVETLEDLDRLALGQPGVPGSKNLLWSAFLGIINAGLTFLGLGDTPDTFVGQDGKKVIVDETTGKLIFAPSSTSSGFYDISASTMLFDGTTLTLSGTYKLVTANGKEFEKTDDTIVVTPYNGLIYIGYNNDGNLQQSNGLNRTQQYATMLDTLPVSYMTYNTDDLVFTFVGDYRKLRSDNILWVKNFFDREVATLRGLVVGGAPWGGGNAAADAQISLSDGDVIFTDRIYNIPVRGLTDTWNIGYLNASLNPVAVFDNPFLMLTDVDLGVGITGRVVYNNDGLPQAAGSGNFVWYFILQTVGYLNTDRVFSFMGNSEYSSATTADDGLANEVATLEARIVIRQGSSSLYGVLVETKSTFTNAVKGRIEEVVAITKDGGSGSPSISIPDELINGSDASSLHNHDSLYGVTAIQHQFATAIVDEDPGLGKWRYNNATQSSATFIYINDNEFDSGISVDLIQSLSAGAKIKIQSKADRSKFAVLNVTGAVIDATGYSKIPIEFDQKGGDFAADDVVGLTLVQSRSDITRKRETITVSANNIDFDFISKNELESDTIIPVSAATTETYTNDTNAEYLKYYVQITNFASAKITLPDISPQANYVQNFEKTAARWNETTRQISFLDNGLYELVHSIDAAGNHFIKISDKYV